MKKIILFVLQLFVLVCNAQNYTAETTSVVNMREGPSTEYSIIKSLKKGAALYVDMDEKINDWYLVVDIENDIEGYVLSKYVRLGHSLCKSKNTSIQKTTQSYNYNPVLHIKNSSSTSMSLRINYTTYKIAPFGEKDVTMLPGKFTYRASAPGVIPTSGEYSIDSNYEYEWEFYIITRRR